MFDANMFGAKLVPFQPGGPVATRHWWLALAAVVFLGACSEPTSGNPLSLIPAVTRPTMVVDGPQEVAGQTGETLADFPRVRVVTPDTGAPVAGVSVTFSRSRDGVSRTVVTDAQGIAHFGAFTFGAPSGPDQVLAYADQMSPLSFTGYVRSTVVTRYDLQLVDGKLLPQIIWVSGWRQVVGGHFVLMADGTYYYFYDVEFPGVGDALPTLPQGRYGITGSRIVFYLTGGFNGLLAWGSIEGDAMQVRYADPELDRSVEEYARR